MKTTDLGHSAWGPRLSHRLTPLPRTQISETAKRAKASTQLSLGSPLHHDRKLKASRTHGPSAPTWQHGPSAPPCRCTRATPPNSHYHCLAKAGLQMRRLQGGHDANDAAAARPYWTGFSPQRVPCCRSMKPHNSALSRENDTTGMPPPSPLTKMLVKAFARLDPCYACHTPLAKPVARSFMPPSRHHRKEPDTASSPTMVPPDSTDHPSLNTMETPDR
ncbi:unnamed protein product [Urochloa humidicola]